MNNLNNENWVQMTIEEAIEEVQRLNDLKKHIEFVEMDLFMSKVILETDLSILHDQDEYDYWYETVEKLENELKELYDKI